MRFKSKRQVSLTTQPSCAGGKSAGRSRWSVTTCLRLSWLSVDRWPSRLSTDNALSGLLLPRALIRYTQFNLATGDNSCSVATLTVHVNLSVSNTCFIRCVLCCTKLFLNYFTVISVAGIFNSCGSRMNCLHLAPTS